MHAVSLDSNINSEFLLDYLALHWPGGKRVFVVFFGAARDHEPGGNVLFVHQSDDLGGRPRSIE